MIFRNEKQHLEVRHSWRWSVFGAALFGLVAISCTQQVSGGSRLYDAVCAPCVNDVPVGAAADEQACEALAQSSGCKSWFLKYPAATCVSDISDPAPDPACILEQCESNPSLGPLQGGPNCGL